MLIRYEPRPEPVEPFYDFGFDLLLLHFVVLNEGPSLSLDFDESVHDLIEFELELFVFGNNAQEV